MENKIPDDVKYITTNNIDKFAGKIFDERLKQAKLATTNDLTAYNLLFKSMLSKIRKKSKKKKRENLIKVFLLVKI